jgi:hypothetical protein
MHNTMCYRYNNQSIEEIFKIDPRLKPKNSIFDHFHPPKMGENGQKCYFLGLRFGPILNISSIFRLLSLQHIVLCMLRTGIGHYVGFRQCKRERT